MWWVSKNKKNFKKKNEKNQFAIVKVILYLQFYFREQNGQLVRKWKALNLESVNIFTPDILILWNFWNRRDFAMHIT